MGFPVSPHTSMRGWEVLLLLLLLFLVLLASQCKGQTQFFVRTKCNTSSTTECQPGYCRKNGTCVCNADRYEGLHCDYSGNNRTDIINGFWMGPCFHNNNHSSNKLCTSHCPLGYCSYQNENHTQKYSYQLPCYVSKLDNFICGPGRTGTLCGECTTNRSVFYHSWKLTCGANDLCAWGWLFYVLSELLPATLLFLVIILLNVNIMTGASNGFILFAQLLDSFSVDGNGIIEFSKPVQYLTYPYRLIYRTFNLDFISLECFSFCPWKGASAFGVYMLKYCTALFSLGMVVCTIFFVNRCHCGKLRFICQKKRSVFKGLCTLFVLCYSQCTRVSAHLLSPICLWSKDYRCERKVVFHSGELGFFEGQHRVYGSLAILIGLFLVIVPMVLLLVYPLCFKALHLCGLSESRLAALLEKALPMQWLDPFQSTFKNRYRFFSGLYFAYRVFALAAYAYSPTLFEFYILVQFQLVGILTLHSIVQPYQKRWHNVLDSLLLLNMSLINGITLYNYSVIVMKYDDIVADRYVNITTALQLLLIYIPLAYMLVYGVLKGCILAYKHCYLSHLNYVNIQEDEGEVPSRFLDEEVGVDASFDNSIEWST